MSAHWLIAGILLAAPAGAQSVKAGIEAWGRADYRAALVAWRPLAAKGNTDAMFNLGQAYRLGRGVPIDLAQAQGWYDRAAHAGHVDAEAQLGILLFQTGNRASGLRWLKSAADKGEARAQLMFGTALFNGDGVERDPLAAYRYIAKSAAHGLAPAKTTVAQMDDAMPADVRQRALSVAVDPAPSPATSRSSSKPNAGPSPLTPIATAPTTFGNWRVQLGAFSQQVSAENLFHKYADGPLGGRDAFFIHVGAVTRLQVGPFSTRAEAAMTCTVLNGRGQPCFVVYAAR